VLGAAVLATGAAGASAHPVLRPHLTRAVPNPLGTFVPASLARRYASNPYASVQLSTYGKPIRINGVTNYMYMDTFMSQGETQPDLFDVIVARGTSAHNQFNDYTWDNFQGIAFSVNHKTLSARFDTGSAVLPSQITMTFAPGQIHTRTCTLHGGGTGILKTTVGTLTVSAFKVATKTSPFFGTITTRPTKAKVWVDPGCKYKGGGGFHRCPAAEVINAPGLAPFEGGGGINIQRTRAAVDSLVPTTSFRSVDQYSHWTDDRVPLSDFPAPKTSATGATATLLTTGAQFVSGTAKFTSTSKPKIQTGSCRLAGVTRTYREATYKGVLSPGSDPLTALLDVGHRSLAPNTKAYLELGRLTG
jgi:hypothetical protein